jgi:hypothetical protein
MTGSHRTRLAVFGAIGLVLALAAPAGAGAAPAPGPVTTEAGPPPTLDLPGAWSPARCATGAVTEVRVEQPELGLPAVWMAGWIQPCADAGSTNGFALIRYHGHYGIRTRGIVAYQSPSAPTTFNLRIEGVRLNLYPNLTAFCVAYDVDGRAACIGIDAGGPGVRAVAAPIPTDDPRVLVPVRLEMVYPTHPTCGTCV